MARIVSATGVRDDDSMPNQFHTLIWIDHRVAKVLHFDDDSNDTRIVHSEQSHLHLHHKANSGDSGHAPVDKHFFERVAESIPLGGPVLIVGPASAKTELHTYLVNLHPQIAARVSAVAPLDHPSEGALLSHGRRFFKADDRMRP